MISTRLFGTLLAIGAVLALVLSVMGTACSSGGGGGGEVEERLAEHSRLVASSMESPSKSATRATIFSTCRPGRLQPAVV